MILPAHTPGNVRAICACNFERVGFAKHDTVIHKALIAGETMPYKYGMAITPTYEGEKGFGSRLVSSSETTIVRRSSDGICSPLLVRRAEGIL